IQEAGRFHLLLTNTDGTSIERLASSQPKDCRRIPKGFQIAFANRIETYDEAVNLVSTLPASPVISYKFAAWVGSKFVTTMCDKTVIYDTNTGAATQADLPGLGLDPTKMSCQALFAIDSDFYILVFLDVDR